jgi:hypothetical protein
LFAGIVAVGTVAVGTAAPQPVQNVVPEFSAPPQLVQKGFMGLRNRKRPLIPPNGSRTQDFCTESVRVA